MAEAAGMTATRRIDWTPEAIAEHERSARPRFAGVNHISLPVRDLAQSKRFYTEVLGGRLVLDGPDAAEVVIGGMVIAVSARGGVPQAAAAEYPHVGLEIAPDQLLPMKRWLEEHGVKTHELWTRNGRTALMFFKDPSGNLFEIYCKDYPEAAALRRGRERASESGIVQLADLDYAWQG
jgi:catechol 2,3-dioxygenase-like lactoylglutathione lyase family enzyme